MRLHRFFVTEPVGDRTSVTINSADLVHQVSRVFRLTAGDRIIIFDGSGYDFECSIDSFGEKTIISTGKNQSIVLSITTKRRSAFSPGPMNFQTGPEAKEGSEIFKEIYIPEVILYMALVKKDTFEWIAEKATELGVTRIIPVLAERSEKKSLNMERLQKIVIEASEQSGRGTIPVIEATTTLEQAMKVVLVTGVQSVVFHTEGERFTQTDLASLKQKPKPLAVFIGPEGGWSPSEIEMFHRSSLMVRSLGPQVLRAETAAVTALSLTIFG